MNLLHMKYAVTVAKTNSINKAAKELFVGQSALSRAIKELETDLGISLFERSAKGMKLTAEGETFIDCAENVLARVEMIENMFKKEKTEKLKFSVSAPRASYISYAFAEFSKSLNDDCSTEIYYRETNSMRTLKNVLEENYKLGIVRYAEIYDKYYKDLFKEKNLNCELVCEFKYNLIAGKDSELASASDINDEILCGYTEIAHADPYVPSLPFAEVKKEEFSKNAKNRIFVFERASQFELLSKNKNTFMWVSPIPEDLLNRYGLIQLNSVKSDRIYKDMLIYKKDHSLSKLDKLFIEKLVYSKRKIMDGQGY